MEWFVAESYQNGRMGEVFEENGKNYVKVTFSCSRCAGTGRVYSMEDNGICWKCYGGKIETKVVRAYTEKEYNALTAKNEKAREKREAEKIANGDTKKKEWLKNNGFNDNGSTYLITGNTYDIKEELKSIGAKFNPTLLWHIAEMPAKYADRAIEIKWEDVMNFNIFGLQSYKTDAAEIVKKLTTVEEEVPYTEFAGEKGEKIKNIEVTLASIRHYDGYYGLQYIYTFKADNYVFTWFTAKDLEIEPNTVCTISSATIKDNTEYRGIKQTVITRAKVIC